jgi:hypothetical protein
VKGDVGVNICANSMTNDEQTVPLNEQLGAKWLEAHLSLSPRSGYFWLRHPLLQVFRNFT